MFKPQLSLFVLLACVACGSNFEAGGSGGTGGSGAVDSGAGASATGGDTSSGASAGESAGGASTAGDSSSGGQATAGSGGAAHGGAASGGTSAGGASAGGNAAGGSAGTDCAALKTEYAALVKKARVCDQGSTDECTTASKAPNVGGCGCPTLVNANSEYTALAAEKYKAIQKNNCDGGLTCGAVCLPPTSASCAQSMGTGSSEFVCTGTNGGIAN
jgi:hypothetical protein